MGCGTQKKRASAKVLGLENYINSYILWVCDSEIAVQVPAIKTCFMSIDEIARIFSKSQSLYRGGEFGTAFIGTQKELEILLSTYRAL